MVSSTTIQFSARFSFFRYLLVFLVLISLTKFELILLHLKSSSFTKLLITALINCLASWLLSCRLLALTVRMWDGITLGSLFLSLIYRTLLSSFFSSKTKLKLEVVSVSSSALIHSIMLTLVWIYSSSSKFSSIFSA